MRFRAIVGGGSAFGVFVPVFVPIASERAFAGLARVTRGILYSYFNNIEITSYQLDYQGLMTFSLDYQGLMT